jgi:uncharacterized protein YjbI with pentapeptide repeats
MEKFDADVVKQMYESGNRDFKGKDLSHLILTGIDLTGIDLREANLQGIDLRNSNLSESCLDGADLYKANLSESNFKNASLNSVNFNQSNLEETQIHNACLNRADLNGTCCIKASFQGADLREIYLTNKSYLKKAYYDELTQFDGNFDPTTIGMILSIAEAEMTIEELLERLNSLSQTGNSYLGNVMTIKYWQSSRPNHQWLQQFNLDKSARITLANKTTEAITKEQQELLQSWGDLFIKSCSQIIHNFADLISKP